MSPTSPSSPAHAAPWPVRLLTRVRPETVLLFVFLAVLGVLWLAYGNQFTTRKWTVVAPLSALCIVVAIAVASRWRLVVSGDRAARAQVARFAGRMIYDWAPFIICYLVYENLQVMTKLIHHGRVFDAEVAAFDRWLFGLQPSLWLQKIANPWLTDYMSFAYGSYFYVPTALAV